MFKYILAGRSSSQTNLSHLSLLFQTTQRFYGLIAFLIIPGSQSLILLNTLLGFYGITIADGHDW